MLTFLFHSEGTKQNTHSCHKTYTILMVAMAIEAHLLTIPTTLSWLKQSPLQAWTDRGFQEVQAPWFQDNRPMKVVRLSVLHTGSLYTQEIHLVLISVSLLSRPQGHSAAERIMSMKNYNMIGNQPVTFWIVQQCLNQLCHCVPLPGSSTYSKLGSCQTCPKMEAPVGN